MAHYDAVGRKSFEPLFGTKPEKVAEGLQEMGHSVARDGTGHRRRKGVGCSCSLNAAMLCELFLKVFGAILLSHI